jgi:hypothetical protein
MGKCQKILHVVEPESESSSYDSLDDSAWGKEEEVADIKKKLSCQVYGKRKQWTWGVDDFSGIGQIICQDVYDYLLLRGRCMAPVTI